VVRTRTDVALYVLNHKRGHLRDLENSFKVTLSIIADASVSGPQAYVIDRGEQVHTLEAAKALLAAQAAASPPPAVEEAYDDEDGFDLETESEVETDETEGLAEEQAAGDAAPEQDGQRRRRRRRRRGRGGQREGELREDTAPTIPEQAMATGESDEEADAEQEGEETEEQLDQARGEQGGGERRRRRGRRGGRRRRGGGEEGLSGSISDELSANLPSEATEAVADFDGLTLETPSIAQTEATVQPAAPQPEEPADAAPAPAQSEAAADESTSDSDKAARRRSTVREKVSFFSSQPEPAAEVAQAPTEVAPPAAEPAPEAAVETPAPQPRRAGWWSRRFGGGE